MKSVQLSELEFLNFEAKTPTMNLAKNCLDSIKTNLPRNASVHAILNRKASRSFETKIDIDLWQQHVFCKSMGLNPKESLQNAQRKILRQISHLRDERLNYLNRSHLEELTVEGNDQAREIAATLSEIL